MNVVLDAAALLAVLLREPGAETVIPILRGASMSAVNLAECCSRAPERGESVVAVLRSVRRFEVEVVPFGFSDAIGAAALRDATRHVGASLGDRACIYLARSTNALLFTGDRRLADLDIGVDIRLIR